MQIPTVETPEDTASGKGSRPLLDLVLVTADPLAKIKPVIAMLIDRPADVQLTVVSGCATDLDEPAMARVRLLRFPGETPFDLRRRLPDVVGDAEWLLLLEDHNHLDRSWLERLKDAVATAAPGVRMIRGGADNRTSTDRWSWANFLMVLGFHWTPRQADAPEAMFFNVAFRRSVLPACSLAVGEFEVRVMATLAEESTAGDFPIDHVQFRRFPGVLLYHWCNGRVTGAAMRRHHRDGWWQVLRHARRVVGERVRLLATHVAGHPHATSLPGGTLARVAALSACHAAGALWGGLAGPGDAARHLE
jgi:hypothetical protein